MKKKLWILFVLMLLIALTGSIASAAAEEIFCQNQAEHQSQWVYDGEIWGPHTVTCPLCGVTWTCPSQSFPDQPVRDADGNSYVHAATCEVCGMVSGERYIHESSCTGDPDTCVWCGATAAEGAVIAGVAHTNIDYDHYDGDLYGHWNHCLDCGERANSDNHWEDSSEGGDGLCDACGMPFMEFPCEDPRAHHDRWIYEAEDGHHTVYCPQCDWWQAECDCIDTVPAAVTEADGTSVTHQTVCARCGYPYPGTEEQHYRACDSASDACEYCGITESEDALIRLTHVSGSDWIPSDNGHYHERECVNCGQRFGAEPHTDENGDGVCDLCANDFTPCDHPNLSGGMVLRDREKHWFICPDCYAEAGHEPHAADENTVWRTLDISHHIAACAVCGYPDILTGECADQDGDGLCDACGQSMAASGITLVPKERLHLDLPEGMAVTGVVIEDGLIDVTIDDDATDWQRVVTTTVGLGTTEINLMTLVDRPADDITMIVTQCVNCELDVVSDEDAILMFREQESYDGYKHFGDYYFRSDGAFWSEYGHATYEPLENKLTPKYDAAPYACFLCWYDGDGYVRKMEKYLLRFHHTRNRQYTVYPPAIPDDRIELTRDTKDHYLSWTYKNGIMHLIGTKELSRRDDGRYWEEFLIQAPVSDVVSCETLLQGTLEVENGQIEFGLSGDAGTDALSLLWYDRNDQLVAYEMLIIEVEITDEGYSPQYYTGDIFRPVPESDLSVSVTGDHQVTKWTYQVDSADKDDDRGVVRYSYKDQLTGLSDLDQAKVTYSVPVPDQARNARYVTVTGAWGSVSGEDGWIEAMIENANNDRHLEPVEDGRIRLTEDLFDVFFRDSNVTVYTPSLPTLTVRGGEYKLILWYEDEDDAEPVWISWFVATSEPFRHEYTAKTVKSADEESEAVTEPECVSPVGTYDLETVHMPQYGLNHAYHVILSLYRNGTLRQPTEDMVFYLPYPAGCGYESQCTYTAYHYEDSFGSAEPIALIPTPHGLKLITSSLSPFVIAAGDGCSHQVTHEESGFEGETTVTDLHNGTHCIHGTWVSGTVCDLCGEWVGEPVTEENHSVTEVHRYHGGSNVCTVCSNDAVLILPGSMKTVEEDAFAGINASVVVIPSSCERIGDGAFSDSGVKLVRFPDSEITLDGDPFRGCEGILLDGPAWVEEFAAEHRYAMFGSEDPE